MAGRPMSDLTVQLRRLQHAANMLSRREFCEALGWDQDDYGIHKYETFRALGMLGTFDDNTLNTAVAAYEAKA